MSLRTRLEELFSEVREGMKSQTIEQIKEILRIEVKKQIVHSKHIFFDTNKWVEFEKDKNLDKVSWREEKLETMIPEDCDTWDMKGFREYSDSDLWKSQEYW